MVGLKPFAIVFAVLALTLPLMPVQLFVRSKRLPFVYHRLLCKLLRLTLKIEGTLPNGPVLLVANHVSWLDIPLLSSAAPVSFIAKREVSGWPFFGSLAKLQHTVFVDRERRHTTGEKRNEIAARLLNGHTLVLFPEGTSSDGTEVLPFKSSYFGAVEGLNIPVVPITIRYEGDSKFYAWFGDMDLLPHLWAVIKSGPIEARIIIHSALVNADRKTMARSAENTIARTLAATLGESQ